MTPTLFWQKVNDYCEENQVSFSQLVRGIEENAGKTGLYNYRTRNVYPPTWALKCFEDTVGADCLYETVIDKMTQRKNSGADLERLFIELRKKISKETAEKQRMIRRIKRQMGYW
ncbi:DUF7339 family protein [Lactococcus taiwanensis]|uniref:DUF7339 family protein n=1 Tax=Lactococcus taiwanensis TaxID=1151742 RepID=UPI0035147D5B